MEPSFPEPASGPFPAATHLGRIFTKTDTKRQADLVKLVAGFAPPVKN
jgi:hypothetical protein